jgi:hypothetical protein
MATKTKKPGVAAPSDSKNILSTALIMTEPSTAGQAKHAKPAPLVLHGLDHMDRELIVTVRQILDRESGCNTPVEELICDLIRMYGWKHVSFEDVEKRFEEFRQLSDCFQEEAIAYIRHNPKLLDKLLAGGAPEVK